MISFTVYVELIFFDHDLVARQTYDTLDQQLVLAGVLVYQITLEDDDVSAFRSILLIRLPVHDHVVILLEGILHGALLDDGRSYEIQNRGSKADCDKNIRDEALDKTACFLACGRLPGMLVDSGSVPEILTVFFVHSCFQITCFVSV